MCQANHGYDFDYDEGSHQIVLLVSALMIRRLQAR
jgi:hypothetical protein